METQNYIYLIKVGTFPIRVIVVRPLHPQRDEFLLLLEDTRTIIQILKGIYRS